MSNGIAIIVAVTNKGVIGSNGKLPWGHLPRDLAHFQKITTGGASSNCTGPNVIVVEYKTIKSMSEMVGRKTNILPGRIIYVLTRALGKMDQFPDCIGVSDITPILALTERKQVFVAGGQEIYQHFLELPQTRVIHMTRIYGDFPGDTTFPELNKGEWEIVKEEFHGCDEVNRHAMRFITLIRS